MTLVELLERFTKEVGDVKVEKVKLEELRVVQAQATAAVNEQVVTVGTQGVEARQAYQELLAALEAEAAAMGILG
jgi:phosphotransferase system HPr-like phosphotransfer protein